MIGSNFSNLVTLGDRLNRIEYCSEMRYEWGGYDVDYNRCARDAPIGGQQGAAGGFYLWKVLDLSGVRFTVW